MARRYQNLKQWNNWLTESVSGQFLLQEEVRELSHIVSRFPFHKHAMLIGVSGQHPLLQQSDGLHQVLISAIPSDHGVAKMEYIEADYQELPIFSGEIDLVLLPHVLEWVEHPRQLLAEACRIVKPEGLIIIFGFNPYSLFKVSQLILKRRGIPWNVHFLSVPELKNWVTLADFQIEFCRTFMYRPLSKYAYFFDKFPLFEMIGRTLFPYYGGIYMLVARAKEMPVTPIKMQWKQRLAGVRISSPISSHPIYDELK